MNSNLRRLWREIELSDQCIYLVRNPAPVLVIPLSTGVKRTGTPRNLAEARALGSSFPSCNSWFSVVVTWCMVQRLSSEGVLPHLSLAEADCLE